VPITRTDTIMSHAMRLLFAGGLLVAIAGCESIFGTKPVPSSLDRVVISPSGDVAAGQTVQISARVLDQSGEPMTGQTVHFAVKDGGGELNRSESATDHRGVASAEWTVGGRIATHRVHVHHPEAGERFLTVTTRPADADSLEIVVPDEIRHGSDAQLEVRAADRFGNRIDSPVVTWSSSDETLFVMSGRTVVTGGVGTGTVTATVDNAYASAEIVILEPTYNLRIDGMHITQGIQRYDGTVPLVARRDGLIRVFGLANEPSTRMPVIEVGVYHDEARVETLELTANLYAVTEIDEGSLDSSWNAPLPGDLIRSGLSLRATINPDHSIPERDYSDNTFPLEDEHQIVSVEDYGPTKVRFVPIHREFDGETGEVPAQLADWVRFTESVFPIPYLDYDVREAYTFDKDVSDLESRDIWSEMLRDMDALRHADGSFRYYYGLTKRIEGSGVGGVAYLRGRVGIGRDNASQIFAHELGHNFGLRHAPCGGAPGTDADFPHANAALGAYGWNPDTGEMIAQDTKHDLMGYCYPRWVSDYNYEKVIPRLRSDAEHPEYEAADIQPGLLVWGGVRESGEVILEPSVELPMRPALPDGTGPALLSGYDASGALLFSYRFTPEAVEHTRGANFVFALPLAVMGGEPPASLRVQLDGRIAERRSSRPDRRAAVRGRMAPRGAEVTWDTELHPLAVVRSARTGNILAFSRTGRVTLPDARADEIDVILSDGVRSHVISRIEIRR
jgi:hypothetical protein